MTKDQALRKALEALENASNNSAAWNQKLEAITAIKEALAQPEQKRPQNCGTGYCSCIECVMEPEQEPVAWMCKPLTDFDEWYKTAIWGNEDFKQGCRRAWDAAIEAAHGIGKPA